MNPQLTCLQRQWLHSSVGRASHRYREVTRSNAVEVLNFFQAFLRNCINCVHCDDHFFIFIISSLVVNRARLNLYLMKGALFSGVDISPDFSMSQVKKTVESSIRFKGSVQLLNCRNRHQSARRRRQTERYKCIGLISN